MSRLLTAPGDTDDAMRRARAVLQSTFGFSTFRPLQEEIVRTVLERRDVFVLMPTGGGKSLCYQLPALVGPGTTVVVSPLIALMKDQVDALRAAGVAATYINSSLEPEEIDRRMAALARGEFALVYVAPERLMLPGFLALLGRLTIDFFAIDEAHCISEWGHDFRPEYRQLRLLRERFPSVPLGAFTATATTRVGADIKRQLGLEDAATFGGSFNRPNLTYEVLPKRAAYDQLLAFLANRRGASGIIYCASRKGTEELATRLRRAGYSAAAYHAGLTAEERRERQEAFVRDDVAIIVATVAFGMGIDKPDVRFVIHYDLPRSLENYYQESGRAGRDGEPSECILFYSAADIVRGRFLIDTRESEAERRVARWQLEQMAGWAESTTCRRRVLLAYFDEVFTERQEPCCDVCSTPATEEDATVPAQMLLSCVKRTGERFGVGHVIDVLRGARTAQVLQCGHDRISTYGIGRERSKEEWRALAGELIRAGYLAQDPDRYNIAHVTEQGRRILFAGERFTMRTRALPARGAGAEPQPHPDLFERLRALRKRLANERDLPPYMVFSNATLTAMTARLPLDAPSFRRLPGVGEQKAREFGPPFLAEIARFVGETGAAPVDAPSPPRPRRQAGASAAETTVLIRAGHSIEEVARLRRKAISTIEEHLAEAIEAGEEIDLDPLVPPRRQAAIEAAFSVVGLGPLSPVREHLGDGFSFGELKLVRARLRRQAESGNGSSR